MGTTITNENTLNALIRDEDMASKEYLLLSKDIKIPIAMRRTLYQMSKDEAGHRENLKKYKQWKKMQK